MLILCSAALEAQSHDSCDSCAVKSVFLESGWKIPGLSGTRIDETRKQQLSLSHGEDPIETGVTVLRPKNETSTTLRIYYFVDGQIKIRDQLVIVGQIHRFDWRGKVFAYGVRYPWAARTKEGKLSELGRETQVLYYDDEGYGVFQTMDQFAGYPFRPSVPDWISKSLATPNGNIP